MSMNVWKIKSRNNEVKYIKEGKIPIDILDE